MCQSKTCSCGCGQDAQFPALDPVLETYAQTPGSLITILQAAQDIYGYLSQDVIRYIAQATGLQPAKVYGVATFYTQFRLKPIGKHLIMLCKGTACHVNGADAIEEAITEELGISDGQTTPDNLFTLNNVACLGCCSLAPVMMIRTGNSEETYGSLTKQSVQTILRDIRAKEVQA